MKNTLISKTFMWMFVGLIITFLTGYFVSTNETMIYNIYKNSTYIILAIAEIALIIFLSARIKKMSANTARICFILYSFVSGLTFSSIFIIYKISSIMLIFLISAIIFLIFGLIGYFTKIDLTKISTYLFMALIAVIICFIINIFLNNTQFDIILNVISILIFVGFTAYDIQKLKNMEDYSVNEDNLSIVLALNLYLDYINIFIDLLRLFGNSRD